MSRPSHRQRRRHLRFGRFRRADVSASPRWFSHRTVLNASLKTYRNSAPPTSRNTWPIPPRWDGGPAACGSLHTRFAGVPALPTLAPHRALQRHFPPCRECLMNCGRFQARWSSGSLTDDPYVTLLRLLRPTGNGNIRSRTAHLDKLWFLWHLDERWFLWHSGLLLITVDKQTSFARG